MELASDLGPRQICFDQTMLSGDVFPFLLLFLLLNGKDTVKTENNV